MGNNSNTWQHRTGTDEERFGLLDDPKRLKYRKAPVFIEPVGSLPDRELIAVGLTCGVGSLLVGAKQLGYKVTGNFEWRDYYRYMPLTTKKSTFTENFPGAFIARGTRDIPKDLMPGRIDFAAGHPECGRYSSLSHSVTKGTYKETRKGDVSDIPLFLKLIALLRPRFFLMDDLPESFVPMPISEYIKLLPDYDLFPEWISNWGYGNIQKRRTRMFMVGSLKKEKFVFRAGEEVHERTLKDEIKDLIKFDQDDIANHANVDLDYRPGRYVNLRSYGDHPSWREIRDSNQNWRQNLRYYTPDGEVKIRPGTFSPDWEGFCPVLSGGFNPVHPLRRLPLSIRERARIQGFPDDFIFYSDEDGPYRQIWEPYNSDGQRGIKQTGKAMPIQFGRFVADQVKHHIEGKGFKVTGRRLAGENEKVSKAKLSFCTLSGYADQDKACRSCWLTSKCEIYKANHK